MTRRWRSLFMALVLLVAVLVPVAVNPATVEAAWNGINMPGRVLRDWGGNTSACRATAYGRVDSNLWRNVRPQRRAVRRHDGELVHR
jgi:hypothetical protein